MVQLNGGSGSHLAPAYHKPKKPTYHLPPVKIVNHHNPTNSQIMQFEHRAHHNNYTPPGYVAPKPKPKPKPRVIAPRHVVRHSTPKPVAHTTPHGSALPVTKPKPVVKTPATKPVTTKPTKPAVDPSKAIIDQLNKAYDAQQQTQLDKLKASQNAAIGQINQQKTQTNQDYYNQKNQADVVSQQNVQRLRELLAANGLNSSGENVTANVNALNARQSALNNLNTKQQQANDAYSQAITNVNDPAKAQAIRDSIAQQRSQALADQLKFNYQFNNLSAAQKASNNLANYQFNNLSAAQKAANALQFQANDAALKQQQADLQAQIAALNNAGFNNSGGGGGNYQSDLAQASKLVHIDPSQIPYLNQIIQKESSFNPTAQNPHSTAHGYGQFLNSTVANYDKKTGLHYNSSPVDQLAETIQYIKDRYGSAKAALEHEKTHGWY